ncbi:gamma-glutamylcyclotransferase [Bacillus timonensis]|nr:gamma-glutamylcyclotransferase [Bacillus timonensis]
MHHVFIDGSLRKGEVNHHLIEDGKRIAEQAWTNGTLYDSGDGYPAMTIENQEDVVYGELYLLTNDQLDEIEYYLNDIEATIYERIEQEVKTDTGVFMAYMYVTTEENVGSMEKIPSGDWKCHTVLMKEKQLYFAYGSCMDDDRFRKASVDHLFLDLVGRGVVKGYSLRFTFHAPDGGRADMVEDGGVIEGKVYQINQEALLYLLDREGVETKWYRPAFVDVEVNGMLHRDMLTFLVIDKKEELGPPIHYATEIVRGGSGCLSDDYVSKVVRDLQDRFGLEM